MSIYKYKAINIEGSIVKGRIDSANEQDLESRLHAMNLELISMDRISQKTGAISGRHVSRQELINFCFHMEQMIRAGVPILESLTDLRDSVSNPRFKEVVAAVIISIEGGKCFSEALREFPQLFDTVFVSLIEAGEESGRLDLVLDKMTESLKWQDELISQTKKLVMYPAFVGTVVIAVVFFLMIYLVPQMVAFIQNMGEELPIHTKLLIATSNFISKFWYVILALPFITYFSITYTANRNESFRYKLDNFKLNFWLIGPVYKKIILARFATYFSLLYRSGVSILAGLKISEEITGNSVIKKALHDVSRYTADGLTLSQSVHKVGLFSPLVVRMLKVGENTGRLDNSLDNVSYFYNRDVKESIEKVQSMIEPVMTVFLGIILGWVMISVLGPIYDIISKVKT
ncbi:Type II secretory pathway, component PulF / Type IV fimbrial assembly protein PilC [hydrothermal vent metagenome]|uniref:Type II secretory pathway, component PulF / Type IV fimbrial assembly protein PilC n=1 Tax=hydrothermal vent metagenome TaxID=652676 RepID=A0A3B0ZEY8_9ZZZZ